VVNLDAVWPFIEPVAVITGMASVALVIRQQIINWPIGITSAGLFIVLFLRSGLYADAILQVFFIVLGFYGWWNWVRGGPPGDDLPVARASMRFLLLLGLASAAAIAGFGAFLDATTDSTVPYPDATMTVLSIAAQVLLTKKLIENWPVWIFGVNLPYIALYLYKGLAMTAGLQLIYIALSVAAWVAWHRSLAARTAARTAASASVEGSIAPEASMLVAPEAID
jgi:nicotinamide mononucleotide transporter